MKITFNFDKDTRALALVPEDDLELCVLNDMATQCAKGTTLVIERLDHKILRADKEYSDREKLDCFRVEMKVNGK